MGDHSECLVCIVDAGEKCSSEDPSVFRLQSPTYSLICGIFLLSSTKWRWTKKLNYSNSQDVGSTYMATNRWTDKEKVGRTQGIIICPLKRSKFCQMWQHGWNRWMKSLHQVKYSRQRRTNTAWFHWFEVSKIVKLIETAEWRMPGAGGRDGRCCSTGIGLQVCKRNKFRRSLCNCVSIVNNTVLCT